MFLFHFRQQLIINTALPEERVRPAFAGVNLDCPFKPRAVSQGESVNILLNFAECFEASIEYLLEVFTTHSSNLLLPSDARFA